MAVTGGPCGDGLGGRPAPKAGATIAADEGATAHELMKMFGWSRLPMAEVYTKEADKKRIARGASERLSN